MMPLVDPRRASSQSETECVVSRASLLPLPLSHRLPKVPQSSEVGRTEAGRTKAAEVKSHPKKPESQLSSKDQQQLQQKHQLQEQQHHQHQQQPQEQQQVLAQLSRSEANHPAQTTGKDALTHKGCVVRGIIGLRHDPKSGKGGESWDPQRLEEESEVALERRRQKLTQELMREMAGDSHHHIPSVDKKMHSQHQHSHRRNPSSSSSSSSSSTSSSSSSSTSSSSDSSPHRSGYKKEIKRKSRPSKRMPSSSDRSRMKKAKSSSSQRKHSSSSSKPSKKSHPSRKDHDKVRSHSHSHSHKSSHSPTRRKTISKKLLSPGRKRTPSPVPSSRKTHKLSPGRSKRSKSRKRSGSPRDRLEYRTERLGLPERSLSHSREANLAAHSSSSSRSRDPRVDDRVRRVSPEQLSRDRYRYEKERLEEYVEPRRERRSPVASRPREVERKDSHRHRDYERHEREHYEERRREDARREEREREQLREREVREREILRDRELMKERERVEMLEREQERERERERLREVEERRSRYGREHEFVREREVVLRGSSRDFEEEREFYAPRVRPELDARVMPVDDRRAYEDTAYDRFQSERERARYESSRSRYEELALHDRRALPPPLDDRCADRRTAQIDTRFSDERRRSGSSLDPRVHDAWMEEQRELERLERSDHYPSHVAPLRHRQHAEWPSRSSTSTWDRHKHARHDEWADEYARSGTSSSRAGEWPEEPHNWVDDRVVAPSSLHQDQWSTHSRRSYRDEWAAREAEWVDHAPPPPYSSSRDLLPSTQSLSLSRERSQQPPPSRRSRREPVEQSLEPPPSRHHLPPSNEEEGLDTGMVAGRGGDMVSPQPSDQDQSLMAGTDGELWEYDPGKGSWVRRPADPTTPSAATITVSRMSSERERERENLLKKEKQAPEPLPEVSHFHTSSHTEVMDERDRKRGPSEDRKRAPSEDRKRGPSEDRKRAPLEERKRSEEERSIEEPEAKRQRIESPPPAPPAPEKEGAPEDTAAGSASVSAAPEAGASSQAEPQQQQPPPPPPPPDPLQEKDTFSDISDDVDDILNQEVGGFNEDDSRNVTTTQVEESRNLSRDNAPTYEELVDEDEETHLEEISDDELEEDRQAKFNVAGALDINWSVLVRDNKPPTNEVAAGTALKRFKAPHLLARLGLSTRFARPELIKGIKEICAAQSDADTKKVEEVEISAVIESGGVARLLKARAAERQRILDAIGPDRKALCARQDIEMRRQLCNLPKQDLIGDSPLLDRDLPRQSLALLKSC